MTPATTFKLAQPARHVDALRPHPDNPREEIDRGDPKILEMADSIEKYGIIEPLVITPDNQAGGPMSNHIDFAVRQFLHKRFVPRPGVDRTGRRFSPDDIPANGDGTEVVRGAQSLFVNRLIRQCANPSDDLFEVESDKGKRAGVRMAWLRLYWKEART